MTRQLARAVYVADQVFLPGTTPPKDAAALIRNEKAWADSEADPEPTNAESDADDASGDVGDSEADPDPKRGRRK